MVGSHLLHSGVFESDSSYADVVDMFLKSVLPHDDARRMAAIVWQD
jgi:hypothetical protein